MAKNLEFSILLDFYGDMLTEKQKEVIEYYYNEDLSLSEIALNQGITRQGVRDSIKRAEALLYDMENRLGLAKKFKQMQDGLESILDIAEKISQINNQLLRSSKINDCLNEIESIVNKLCE